MTDHLGLLRPRGDRGRDDAISAWFRSTADRGRKMHTLEAAPPPGAAATALAPEDLHPSGNPADLVRRALDEGFTGAGVLVRADRVVAARSRGFHDEVETALTGLCADHPVAVLCVYDRPGAGVDCLDLAVGHHGDGLDEPQLAVRRIDDALHLRGEIDTTNLDVVETALRGVEEPNGRLCLDLTEVGFLSAGAAQLLHQRVLAMRAAGARVELQGVSAHTARVLRLIAAFSRSRN